MQKNYLILAHKNPLQLSRMIERLDDGASKFFIHLDAKTPIEPFAACLEGAHIRFIDKRERCVWGDFSIVQATIRLMEAASKEQGIFILMSGQDYPIQSQGYINDFLERNKEFDFIEIEPLEEKWKPKMVKDKLEHYHILHSEERGNSNCYAPFRHCSVFQKLRTLTHLLKGRLSVKNFKLLCSLPKRVAPFERQYAGSQFWAFSERTFYAVLHYIREHKAALEGYYKYTSSPDEIYFHSVLMDLVAKDSTIKLKDPITYVNYFRKNNVFITEDFDKITSAKGKLFARKFDTDIDIEILNKLDSNQENES
ncbi:MULTISPECIES: beta-1,6-N-acetylglucosaminyltransferase [Capnocytophaga]|jgi:alr4323 protein|uniref:beta-1,6-N-acetylglucosaminyltransferase n=1 Tax=Capnocytophaga TaxID=1016 RepID=UPI00020C5D4E|nr:MULTISPECIES: beta-1,6-N-acetylglucosaminyltransferase [Capnocytophaga]KHE70430.1 Core-2/I-Branching enzyme [Capnocytophaga sp. oral taxon 329 str. F0087]QGS18860.1 core-2/I-branching enzyme [Capnocytophaga sp. FDAARGOS_737]